MIFKELEKDCMPDSNKLVWIRRNNGTIYIGYREDKPMSENADPSRDCFWWGNPDYCMLYVENTRIELKYNFSDITVDSWADIDVP